MKLTKLQLLGPSLARAASKALREPLIKYPFEYLILYS